MYAPFLSPINLSQSVIILTLPVIYTSCSSFLWACNRAFSFALRCSLLEIHQRTRFRGFAARRQVQRSRRCQTTFVFTTARLDDSLSSTLHQTLKSSGHTELGGISTSVDHFSGLSPSMSLSDESWSMGLALITQSDDVMSLSFGYIEWKMYEKR